MDKNQQLMGQQRYSRQEDQAQPLLRSETAGSEGSYEKGTFGYQGLQADAKEEGGQHQLIFQVIHAEKAGFYIPHAYGVEELGDSKHGECIGLTAGQKPGILKKGV